MMTFPVAFALFATHPSIERRIARLNQVIEPLSALGERFLDAILHQ
jgi:hypothetical protein